MITKMEEMANLAIDELCDLIGEDETIIRFFAKGCSFEDIDLFFVKTDGELKELKEIAEEREKEWR